MKKTVCENVPRNLAKQMLAFTSVWIQQQSLVHSHAIDSSPLETPCRGIDEVVGESDEELGNLINKQYSRSLLRHITPMTNPGKTRLWGVSLDQQISMVDADSWPACLQKQCTVQVKTNFLPCIWMQRHWPCQNIDFWRAGNDNKLFWPLIIPDNKHLEGQYSSNICLKTCLIFLLNIFKDFNGMEWFFFYIYIYIPPFTIRILCNERFTNPLKTNLSLTTVMSPFVQLANTEYKLTVLLKTRIFSHHVTVIYF